MCRPSGLLVDAQMVFLPLGVKMKGRILSIESMGLTDGPGIRTVIFFMGCALRCKFCHNPDTWDMTGGTEMDSEEIISKILRFRPYFERSGGGVTFSGGEPLLQSEFLLTLLKRCKAEGIHTAIDTAGVGVGRYEEILSYTDLVLYDVKAISAEAYEDMCANSISHTELFAEALNNSKCDITVRAVIIPGVNDSDEAVDALKKYIREKIPRASKVELLPYHKMGVHKYKMLGLSDPLWDTDPMNKEKTKELYEKHFKYLK